MVSKPDWLEEVPILDFSEPIVKAIPFFREGHDIVIVVNEKEKYEGMIRTHDVIGIYPRSLCKTCLNKNIPTFLKEDPLDFESIGEMMLNGKTRYIPVLDKYSRVKGAIKDLTVLKELLSGGEGYNAVNVKNVTNWNLVYLSPSDNIGTAVALMREYGFSRIPVMTSSEKLDGIIINRTLLHTKIERRTTSGDIIGSREKDWQSLLVSNFMSAAKIIPDNTPLSILIDDFVDSGYHSFVVKSPIQKYGIITPLDIIQFVLTQNKGISFDIIVTQAPDEDIQLHAIRKSRTIMERERWLSPRNMYIRFKRNLSQSKRGMFSITATIRLISTKGQIFNSKSTDFGAEKAVNDALDNLSRILTDAKKKILDRRNQKFSPRKMLDHQ